MSCNMSSKNLEHLATMTNSLANMISRIKSEYLDNRNVGIRKFSDMTGIRRTRLKNILEGIPDITVDELNKIREAIEIIEQKYLNKHSQIKTTL